MERGTWGGPDGLEGCARHPGLSDLLSFASLALSRDGGLGGGHVGKESLYCNELLYNNLYERTALA